MILTQPELRKAVKSGKIAFSPELEDAQWGEASIDLRLGFDFTVFKELQGLKLSVASGLGTVGTSGLYETIQLKEFNTHGHRESYTLYPSKFVLAMTYEAITVPSNMIARVEGRSTYARVGLSMHQTAPWIQPGWNAPIVLEIMNSGTIAIELTPKIDRPCQITFFKFARPLPKHLLYGSRVTDIYQHQTHPLKHKNKKK